MHNNTLLVKEILSQIDTAIETIKHRFEPVTSVDYFLDTPEGQEKLDSICMLFIAIGEGLKKIDSLTNRELLAKYDTIDWRSIKGLRDIHSHHYFDVNAEAIYGVCSENIDELHEAVKKILREWPPQANL